MATEILLFAGQPASNLTRERYEIEHEMEDGKPH
jgi:hypothetical protein